MVPADVGGGGKQKRKASGAAGAGDAGAEDMDDEPEAPLVPKMNGSEVVADLAKLILSMGWPIAVVENPAFRKWCSKLGIVTTSRRTMGRVLSSRSSRAFCVQALLWPLPPTEPPLPRTTATVRARAVLAGAATATAALEVATAAALRHSPRYT